MNINFNYYGDDFFGHLHQIRKQIRCQMSVLNVIERKEEEKLHLNHLT